MAFTTFVLCVAVFAQHILANATGGRERRARPTIPTGETKSNSMLVICSPDEGCFSQYGDSMNCDGVDVTHRVVFLRTVENRGESGAYYVYQQFSLPNSLFRARNFGKVIDEVNAQANPAPEGNVASAPGAQPAQPVVAAAQPVSPPTLVTVARTGLVAQPITQAPSTRAPRTRPPFNGGAEAFTGVQRPVCRFLVIAAFGSPFGLCCGPCRY
ncbi:hypothetical protein BWQ96_01390 [Gracilariopsis chorda]|uniref:Uncharacterized protein n=1 Tax=Gracilariopsis chorda TaxID=448386 RepID=A0A2V3J376_9FLOR|nr:hypothetical protein BWQ96_01390 [Gracilariopsis chorda]|eukprot:PXF48834.1 hypothetical protein BWQ96_01390 [Gracilariopsis chorda]